MPVEASQTMSETAAMRRIAGPGFAFSERMWEQSKLQFENVEAKPVCQRSASLLPGEAESERNLGKSGLDIWPQRRKLTGRRQYYGYR